MQRFVLRSNIEHFQALLATDVGLQERKFMTTKLIEMQRDLALLEAASLGAQRYRSQFGRVSASERSLFRHLIEDSSKPYLIVDPRPGLHIVDINDAYAAATMTERGKVSGEGMFDVFPDNPELPDADGVNNLFQSLYVAAQNRQSHAMAIQRYDVRNPDGLFVERYWRPLNTPIFNDDGQLVWLLHHVEDVTDQIAHLRSSER